MNFIWSSFSVFMIYQAEAKRFRPFLALPPFHGYMSRAKTPGIPEGPSRGANRPPAAVGRQSESRTASRRLALDLISWVRAIQVSKETSPLKRLPELTVQTAQKKDVGRPSYRIADQNFLHVVFLLFLRGWFSCL
jgi:hypothetical protein